MAVIDPVGLFKGDRLRRCSNQAQLHWPRLFLASDGYGRLELNYAVILGTAYPTFNPLPSETELQSFIQEFIKNFLLFVYEVDGRTWGQWDTRPELLPRYKTAMDRRSPSPPEPAFTEWKRRYRAERNGFPKSFGKISECFLHGVGVGVGVGEKLYCPSSDGRSDPQITKPDLDKLPFDTLDPVQSEQPKTPRKAITTSRSKEPWKPDRPFMEFFDGEFWPEWPRKEKKKACVGILWRLYTERDISFLRETVLVAIRKQKRLGGRLNPPNGHEFIPLPTTWLNGEEWENEAVPDSNSGPSIYTRAEDDEE